MNNNTAIEWLKNIREFEGEEIEMDEPVITNQLIAEESAFSNIAIKVLSIAGGILAALFFAGFLFVLGISENHLALIFSGFFFVGAVFVMNKKIKNITLDTITISFYLMGVLMIWAGFDQIIKPDLVPLVLMGISIFTLFLTNGFMLVFISILLFNGALFAFLDLKNWDELIKIQTLICCLFLVWLTVYEFRIISFSSKANQIFKPLQAALFISFVVLLLYVSEYKGSSPSYFLKSILAGGIAIINLAVLHKVFQQLNIIDNLHRLIPSLLLIALHAFSFHAPYIGGAILLILLSFHYRFISQLVISLLLLIYGTSRFYYNLNETLLTKSGILMMMGILILTTWFYFTRQTKLNEKV